MDKLTKQRLNKTIEICQNILDGNDFHLNDSEINCIPTFIKPKSKTAAKKDGLILKKGQKRICSIRFRLSTAAGWGEGELYMGKSFKKSET